MLLDTKLNIVSFNVLSRNFSQLQMILKKLNLSKEEIKILVKKEIKRFNQIVGPELVQYFKLILPNTIIFLQEVNENFLALLKIHFKSNQIFYTNERDYTIQTHKNKTSNNYNDDHRVILLPEILFDKKISTKEIQIVTTFASKSILIVSVQLENKLLVLINLHLHWKMTYNELEMCAEKINGELKKSFINLSQLQIIICGDFNKGIKKVEKFFINPLNLFGFKFKNNYNITESGFTSHTTDSSEVKKYDIIDHIITHNIHSDGYTQIVPEIAGKVILTNTKNQIPNISDHNLIKLKFLL